MSGARFFCRGPVRTARKQRTCHWCGEPIKPGEQCVHLAGVFEGDFWWADLHAECDNALDRDLDTGDGWQFYAQRRGMTIQETEEALHAEIEADRQQVTP